MAAAPSRPSRPPLPPRACAPARNPRAACCSASARPPPAAPDARAPPQPLDGPLAPRDPPACQRRPRRPPLRFVARPHLLQRQSLKSRSKKATGRSHRQPSTLRVCVRITAMLTPAGSTVCSSLLRLPTCTTSHGCHATPERAPYSSAPADAGVTVASATSSTINVSSASCAPISSSSGRCGAGGHGGSVCLPVRAGISGRDRRPEALR